ncbi:MAG: ribose-5-phosphate isomerase RpiA [Thermomicrobiales bacterium]
MELPERLAILGRHAALLVEPDTRVGLGSGSTAEAFIRALGDRVSEGLLIEGIATSRNTERLASSLAIPLVSIDRIDSIDVGVDGADEIDPALNLTKGRGGALLFEKLVARACRQFVVVAASEKVVPRLGMRTPLPVEVVPFAWHHTSAALEALGLSVTLRRLDAAPSSHPFLTDGGHFILDCVTGPVSDAPSLANLIKAIPGVVDHGYFVGMASTALIVDPKGEVKTVVPVSPAE